MAQPTITDVHVDAILSNVSIAYQNALYIGKSVVPMVRVLKSSDKYFIFDQAPQFRNEAGVRAPGTTGPVGGYTLSTATYNCVQKSMAAYVADEERANADPGLDLDRQAAEYCADKVLMDYEKAVATLVFGSGNYASGHTATLVGANQWNDPASVPIDDVRAGIEVVRKKIGRRPNTLVLGGAVMAELQDHPDLADRIKYSQLGVITPGLLAALFDVDRVLIGDAVENTAAEGATAVYADIWGKFAALLWVPPAAALRTLSYAYGFIWRERDFIAERWRKSDGGNADGYRVSAAYDVKLTANTAGYLVIDAIA